MYTKLLLKNKNLTIILNSLTNKSNFLSILTTVIKALSLTKKKNDKFRKKSREKYLYTLYSQ